MPINDLLSNHPNYVSPPDIYQDIIDQVSKISTNSINDTLYKEGVDVEVIEKQKVYLWVRLFLEKPEDMNALVSVDDKGNINLKESNHENEKLETSSPDEELYDLKVNDDLLMEYKWAPGEKIMTKFACYGKQGVQRDHENEIVGYNPEDDKRVICLLVDSDIVNYSDDVPFLRRLFKASFHFQEEIIKRQDLTFTNQRTNEVVKYFDIDI